MRTHHPGSPFFPICHIAKGTTKRVSQIKDGKADNFVDSPKQPPERLTPDEVILAKGSKYLGVGIGGVGSHHVVHDMPSRTNAAAARHLQSRSEQAPVVDRQPECPWHKKGRYGIRKIYAHLSVLT